MPAHPLARRLAVAALLLLAALGATARDHLRLGPVRQVTGLGTTVTVVVAVLAAVQVVVLLLALAWLRPRHRRRRDEEGEHAPAELPIPGWARVVALIAGLALLAAPWFALLLALGHGGTVTAPHSSPAPPPTSTPASPPTPGTTTPHAASTATWWPLLLTAAVVTVVVLTAMYALAVRRRRAGAASVTRTPASATGPTETPRGDRPRAEQDGGVTGDREAVIAAWRALGRYWARHGVPHIPADTPAALVARAEAAGEVGAGPGRTLARLFREARFSSHPITAQQRRQAEQLLRDARARTRSAS